MNREVLVHLLTLVLMWICVCKLYDAPFWFINLGSIVIGLISPPLRKRRNE